MKEFNLTCLVLSSVTTCTTARGRGCLLCESLCTQARWRHNRGLSLPCWCHKNMGLAQCIYLNPAQSMSSTWSFLVKDVEDLVSGTSVSCPQDLDVWGLRAVNKQLQSQAVFVIGFGKIAGRVFSVIPRPQFYFGRCICNMATWPVTPGTPSDSSWWISRIVTRHVSKTSLTFTFTPGCKVGTGALWIFKPKS